MSVTWMSCVLVIVSPICGAVVMCVVCVVCVVVLCVLCVLCVCCVGRAGVRGRACVGVRGVVCVCGRFRRFHICLGGCADGKDFGDANAGCVGAVRADR